jgi:hypothetical protein
MQDVQACQAEPTLPAGNFGDRTNIRLLQRYPFDLPRSGNELAAMNRPIGAPKDGLTCMDVGDGII